MADERIAQLTGLRLPMVREMCLEQQLHPHYKVVDTCAAQFGVDTPYFYSPLRAQTKCR